MPDSCRQCGAPLTQDEVGLTKKLINRGCKEFLCFRCMAQRFDASVDELRRKVEEFREMGCTLFE